VTEDCRARLEGERPGTPTSGSGPLLHHVSLGVADIERAADPDGHLLEAVINQAP
jgi:hypothetical protein